MTTIGNKKPYTPKPAGIVVHMPGGMQPNLHIPYDIAKEWMEWGMLGYRDHNSEWGCAVKLHRDDKFNDDVHVVDYHMYNLEASGGYWESIEGERERHAADLIASGNEDDLQYWNGLFHTHPIGSSAHMSGTDMDQVKELAGANYWGISIICPANKEGTVNPHQFMYHYADSRQFNNGMIVVENMKPAIVADGELPDPWEEKSKFLAGMMHKRVLPVKSSASSKVWRASDKLPSDDEINRLIMDAENSVDEAHLTLSTMFRDPSIDIEAGDWIYVKSMSKDPSATYSFNADELKKYEEMAGRVVKVSMSTSGSICAEGFWLCPQIGEDDTDPYVDFVYRLAEKGSPAARLLDNQKEKKRGVRATLKMFKDAGIEDYYLACKDINYKKKATK
jgi:hypothetical protein